jgi:hypothetical protein
VRDLIEKSRNVTAVVEFDGYANKLMTSLVPYIHLCNRSNSFSGAASPRSVCKRIR